MPKGPKGERRPADVIGNAVKVMRIATGEEREYYATRLRSVKQLLKVPARAVSKGAKPERLSLPLSSARKSPAPPLMPDGRNPNPF
jgi:hypothetical protein